MQASESFGENSLNQRRIESVRGGRCESVRSDRNLLICGIKSSGKDTALDGCPNGALDRRSHASEVEGEESEGGGFRTRVVNSEGGCALCGLAVQ